MLLFPLIWVTSNLGAPKRRVAPRWFPFKQPRKSVHPTGIQGPSWRTGGGLQDVRLHKAGGFFWPFFFCEKMGDHPLKKINPSLRGRSMFHKRWQKEPFPPGAKSVPFASFGFLREVGKMTVPGVRNEAVLGRGIGGIPTHSLGASKLKVNARRLAGMAE